ncbi:hypothetical protein BIW11_03074, partial [Tropilaelaps mercedesae]
MLTIKRDLVPIKAHFFILNA